MENYNGNSNGKFNCPVYNGQELTKVCKKFCPYINDLSGPCFRQSLVEDKFLVYKQSTSSDFNDFLLLTKIIKTEPAKCSLDQLFITGIDFRRRTLINFNILTGDVLNNDSVVIDFLGIKVVGLVDAFNLGFRVFNKDYWEKNVTKNMNEEYKKLARKNSGQEKKVV